LRIALRSLLCHVRMRNFGQTFVTGFYRSVSHAAAPQLLWQELFSFIFGSIY